ncbi:MAG TPA: class I SAM-dependent methyltransferase [Candidatus Staskawiczbacteria bacterium]|nr:class I SAM-dependent methyltransferase [Candidatus Staskawiczbacteria bacterium]
MDFVAIIFFVVVVASLGAIFDAPWVPTGKKDYDRIAKLADLEAGQTFWDIGSGSGNLLFYAAQKYDAKCVGIEISPIWYAFSKIKSLFYKNVKIKFGDFHDFDFNNADVVYTFLTQPKYKKVKEKFDKEAKPGAKLIFAVWPVPDQTPNAEDLKPKSKPYYKYVQS